MATKNHVHVTCDHVNPDNGRACDYDMLLDQIPATRPSMHLTVKVEMVDCTGRKTIVEREIDTCHYDVYWALSSLHDLWSQAVQLRVEEAQRLEEALENNE